MLTRRRIALVVVSLLGMCAAIFLTRPYDEYFTHLPISWVFTLIRSGILFLPLAIVIGVLKIRLRITIVVFYLWVYASMLQTPIGESIWDQLYQVSLWTITLGTLSVIFLLLVAFASSALVDLSRGAYGKGR
jgi:hypothetical protein